MSDPQLPELSEREKAVVKTVVAMLLRVTDWHDGDCGAYPTVHHCPEEYTPQACTCHHEVAKRIAAFLAPPGMTHDDGLLHALDAYWSPVVNYLVEHRPR